MSTPDTKESKFEAFFEPYPAEQRSALPILLDLQEARGHVPDQACDDLADYLGCAAADLYAEVTFLKSLSVEGGGTGGADELQAKEEPELELLPVPGDGADGQGPIVFAEEDGAGSWAALRRALEMTPEDIVAQVEESGIRGKGGAGFPTGRKWRSCLEAMQATDGPSYLICNGTEGDPEVYVDGTIMRLRPRAVLEGIAIGALAIGAEEAYLYLRSDYVKARAAMQAAIEEAESAGVLGDSVLGTDRKLHVRIVRSGGLYVCGESTALMRSMEGLLPEARPGYGNHATSHGLFGCPTVLNNVETLAAIPWIFRHGAAEFAAIGTQDSTGTKVFQLTGAVAQPGIVEVPFGTTLRELAFGCGGGMREGSAFKALLPGGPSDSIVPEALLDTPIGFEAMRAAGIQMGSGRMEVLDEGSCVVELLERQVAFLAGQSCGRCTPCREGLRQLAALLARIRVGQGKESDLALMERLAQTMEDAALCALGRSVANPVLASLHFFRGEWEEHVGAAGTRRCRAGACKLETPDEGSAA